jgi:hypothetical protein
MAVVKTSIQSFKKISTKRIISLKNIKELLYLNLISNSLS